MNLLVAALAALFVFGVAERTASALTCRWIATGNSTFGNSTANWSCGRIPTSADTVVFEVANGGTNRNCTFNQAVNVISITIQTNFTSTVGGGTNTITTSGGISMTSAATFNASSAAMSVGGAFSMSAGTFAGGSSSIGVASFSHSGGTFTSTSGTLTVAGAFSRSGGTFASNGGTVLLTGTGALTTNSNTTFDDLTVNATSGTYTLTGSLTVNATTTSTLTVTSGTLTSGANTVSVSAFSQSGGTFNSTSGTMTVAGAFTRSGGTFASNSGTVTLTGTGALTTNSNTTFDNLTVNTATGTYTLTGSLTLTNDAASTLTMSSGTLTIGANSVSVNGAYSQGGGTFSGGSSSIGFGSFGQTAGTFTSTSGTLSVAGAFTRSGGTFASNGGTVQLTGTGALTTNSTTTFHNLTVNTTSGTYTLTGTLTLTNNTMSALTMTSGTLTIGTNTVSVNGAYSQTNGTFTASSSSVGLGSFNQSGGTFTSTSGTLTVAGAFSRSGGTFSSNSGTVALTGTGALTTNSNTTFNNLTVNTASGTYTLTGTLTLTATSTATLTMTSGTLTCGSSAVSMGAFSQSGGTFNATSGTTTVGGSFTRTGGVFAGNGGTVLLTGSGSLTTNGGSLANLTVTASGTYTLGDALLTSGVVSVTSGTLTAGANSVTVGSNFTQSGGTFNASSGTTTVTGSFSRSGGTFNANGGTLTLNGTTTLSHTFSGATMAKVLIGQDSGLVGYWKLDEASGSVIADSSAYANAGNLAGGYSRTTPPAAISFSDSNALTFDGTSGSGIGGITGLPANNAAQTISLWVNLSDNTGIQNMLALINTPSASAVQVGIRNGSLTTWSYGGATLVSTTLPGTGAWHHVAYTFDGTTHRLYLDGVAGTPTTNTPQTATPIQTYFGSYDGVNEFLKGSLDDVRVYNRQLSASEIATLAGGSNLSVPAGGTHTFADAFVSTDDLTIGTGTLTGTNTLSVGGSWLNTGGTFSGTGAVTLTGTATDNIVVSRGSQFSSLTVNGSGGQYTFADAMVDTGNFTIASNATVAGSGTMTVGGNWDNSGTFIGTGAVTLNGTGARTLKSNGGRFSSLTINSSGGTYTLQDRLWVPGGTVTLQNGTLAAGTNTARVGAFSVGSGTFTYSSTGTLIIDGASNQTLPFSSYAGALRMEDPTETSLKAYWKLDAGVGRQVYDFTGNGNNGTLSSAGTTWQTGVASSFGYENPASVLLNGSSGYASMTGATLPAINHAQTISFWVNPTSTADTATLFAVTNSAAGNGIQIGFRGGLLTVWNWGGTVLVSAAKPSAGAWHHIAYTYDGNGTQGLTVDGVTTTAAVTTAQTSTPNMAYLGTYDGGSELYSGAIDDVRVYDAAMTSTQLAQLAAGRYAGTGGLATYSLGSNTTVAGQLFVDDVIFSGNGRTMNVTGAAQVNTGTYDVGSATQTFSAGLAVKGGGTLSMTSSTSTVAIASAQTLTIDGTLTASNAGATITNNGSGTYTFKVGSTSTARPTLNITGLAVKNTDASGMWIDSVSGSATTFTRFDNIAFNNGVAGAGAQYLQISANSVYATANGLSFGVGEAAAALPVVAVKLTGNGTSDGETRIVIGNATCATSKTDSTTGLCVTTWKTDDDANYDGVGDNTGSNGAVAQFIRGAGTDTAGTIEGLPTAAFDWNTFTYYSTYVAFHDASGTSDRIYVRDQSGAAKYYWETPASETIVGTPRWTTTGTTHYVFVALSSGKVYRLIDDTTSQTLTPDSSGNWAGSNNPYDCSCTIVTPLVMDTNNVYWGGTQSGNKVWTLGQTSRALPTGSPFSVTPTITTSAPALWTSGTTTYLFLGVVGHILKIDVTNQVLSADNTSPGSATVYGRIGLNALGSAQRVYAGDDAGRMWAIDPASFAGAVSSWSYTVASDAIRSSPYFDYGTSTLHFGTEAGKVVALNSTGSVLVSGYPYTPGTSSDRIRTEVLYRTGVLAVGTTTGKLFFLDRNNGSNAAALIRQYYFGATESVSGIGFDAATNRYLVSTSSSSGDGRLYVFDSGTTTGITDPTASTQ